MKSNTTKQYLGIILTLLIASYFVCLSQCLHTHIVDSKLITHSHPYKTASHTHSGAEVLLIKTLSNFETEILTHNIDISPDLSLISETNNIIYPHVEQIYFAHLSLRAPPSI